VASQELPAEVETEGEEEVPSNQRKHLEDLRMVPCSGSEDFVINQCFL